MGRLHEEASADFLPGSRCPLSFCLFWVFSFCLFCLVDAADVAENEGMCGAPV